MLGKDICISLHMDSVRGDPLELFCCGGWQWVRGLLNLEKFSEDWASRSNAEQASLMLKALAMGWVIMEIMRSQYHFDGSKEGQTRQ